MIAIALAAAGLARSGLPAGTPQRGPELVLKRTCTRCHGLDVIRAQRLTREEWDRELDKMTRMGARIANRAALLDYLVKNFGDQP